jgi:DNA-binding SARP family transcriptional activator/class 3 adenylate cyclase
VAEPDAEVFTFLLTDIVGSVTLWADDEVAMNRALAEHDVMLHDLIDAHGGILGNRTGDGRWARFARPHAAVEAALKIQEAFRHKEWEVVGALHVRVALHTGPAIARDDDYFGNTLNQTSRLADAAEGGEILASAVVVDAVRHHLPPGVTVMSLGDLRLRGLRERLRAYQIVPPPDVPATAVGSADLAPGTPPATALQILTLGTFRVVGNGRPVPDGRWGRRKARQLFKCLITRPGRRLTRDDAYELFWPESDAAPNNLRVAIHAVRQAVESTGLAGLDNLLVLDHDGLAMRPEGAVWVDADAFEQLLAQARRASEPAPFLEAAADLYRGDYLPDDLFEDWSVARRESLRRQWTDLQLELGRVRELRDDVEGAVSALQRLLDADSCHEQAANDLMLVLARHGRRPDALRVFQRLADALRRELGVEPSDDVRETRRKIVDGEVAAEVRRRRELVRPTVPAEHLAGADLGLGSPVQLSETSPEPRDAPRPAIAFQPGYPFPSPELLVGRQREQLWLRQALDRGRTEGRTFVIGAPAGAGKSTIAGLLVREARARGFLCLAGGTFYQESPIPYGPIRDALADYLLSLPRERLRADMGELVADLEPIVPELRYHLGLPDTHASEPVDASWPPSSRWCSVSKTSTPLTRRRSTRCTT